MSQHRSEILQDSSAQRWRRSLFSLSTALQLTLALSSSSMSTTRSSFDFLVATGAGLVSAAAVAFWKAFCIFFIPWLANHLDARSDLDIEASLFLTVAAASAVL